MSDFLRRAAFACAPFVCGLAFASHAHAHALLRSASPSAGSTLPAGPAELTIDFSEGVEPHFSSIAVTDAAGARVDKNDVHRVSGHGTRLAVSLGALPAGTYKVVWHAVSVDTHKTQGSYSFTVGP